MPSFLFSSTWAFILPRAIDH